MVPSCYDVRAACRIITMRRQVQLPKTAIKKAVNKPHNNSHSWCFSSLPVCQLTSLHPPTTPLLLPLETVSKINSFFNREQSVLKLLSTNMFTLLKLIF